MQGFTAVSELKNVVRLSAKHSLCARHRVDPIDLLFVFDPREYQAVLTAAKAQHQWAVIEYECAKRAF